MTLLAGLALTLWAQDHKEELRLCMEKNGFAQISGFAIKQTIEKEGQDCQKYKADCYLDNKGEKMIIEFKDPPGMANTKVLFKDYGKLVWMYFPASNRVRKIVVASNTEKVGNLGFTYSDFFPYMQDENHSVTLAGEKTINNTDCIVYEINNDIKNSVNINKTRLFISKSACKLIHSEAFTSDNRLVKRIDFNNYKTVENKNIPSEIIINQDDLGEKVTINILGIECNKKYSPSYFSEISLKR
jgi:outer membrane lipoprotein-sorting protein